MSQPTDERGTAVRRRAAGAPRSAGADDPRLPAEFVQARQQLMGTVGSDGLAGALRDAGFHIGESLYSRFSDWLSLRGDGAPPELSDEGFTTALGEFFEVSGWGQLRISPLSRRVLTVETSAWCEAQAGDQHCVVTTGLLTGFFSRYAGAPVACMEVACRVAGLAQCRFLLGPEWLLRQVHTAMLSGVPVARAVAQHDRG